MLETWILLAVMCEMNGSATERNVHCYTVPMPATYSTKEKCMEAVEGIRRHVNAQTFGEWRSPTAVSDPFGRCVPLLVEK